MTGFLDQILGAPAWAVLAAVALLVFVEDALFVGFVIPGETAALLGGVAAQRGHVPLAAVIVTVVIAAVAGDSVGYEVGRHLGPRILQLPILAKRRARLWGTVVVTGGYLAGASYARVEAAIGRDTALIGVGIALSAVVVWRIREHRATRARRPNEDHAA